MMERKNSFVLCLCLILLGAICLTSFGVSAEHDSLLKVNKTQTNSSTTAANAASSSAASTKISAKGKAKTKTEAKKKNIGDMFRKVNTLIRRAIEEGNLPEFQKLWTSALKPEEINHVHKDGATPLLLTIEHGQREMFESVMQSKPDLNLAHGTTGDTPLVAAIMKKDALMATSLIHNNADVNLGNSVTGLMPLGAVISSKENAAVLINPLIKKGAAKEKCFTSNNTPSITFACASNNLEAVQILLAAGVNVNAMGDEGLSSMDHAVENGNLEMVNDLIEAGYDMKRAGGAGLLAAKTGNTSLMQALITAGIDVNAVGSVNTHAAFDGRGQKVKHTALTIAVEVDDEAMVDLLLNRNANPNLYGPLLRVSANILNIGTSAPHNFTAIAMKLVEAGADVNAQFDRERDYQKWANYSPLTVCFNKFQDYTDLVTFYLDKGVDLNRPTPHGGYTPLMIAVKAYRPKYVKLLLERGADSDVLDLDGGSALLHAQRLKDQPKRSARAVAKEAILTMLRPLVPQLFTAASQGDTAALEAAIKRQQSGRYPPIDEYRDKTSGNNALMEAASKGHYECVNELLAAGADVYETNRVSKKSVSAIAKESANVQITSVIDGEVAFQNWLGEEVEEGQPSHLPGKYKCSITQDLMYVPVYVPANKEHPRDSDSYERWAVLKWLQTNRELPNDRRKVSKEDLVVNTELIEEIKVFRQKWLDANTNMSATGAAQKALLQHKQKPHKGKQ